MSDDPVILPWEQRARMAEAQLHRTLAELAALRTAHEEALQQLGEARANARVLASAWTDDARPPGVVVAQSLGYAVDQRHPVVNAELVALRTALETLRDDWRKEADDIVATERQWKALMLVRLADELDARLSAKD